MRLNYLADNVISICENCGNDLYEDDLEDSSLDTDGKYWFCDNGCKSAHSVRVVLDKAIESTKKLTDDMAELTARLGGPGW